MRKQPPCRGFTLLEMSMVLLVISLIIGGIFAGQELLRASQLNSIVVDLNYFHAAVDGFKIKYRSLPGDMSDATHYFGTTSAGCPNGAGVGNATCNGNGDGRIGTAGGTGIAGETLRVWQHLAAAGLIPNAKNGYYTGVPGPLAFTVAGVGDHRIGTNAPSSKIKGVGYGAFYLGNFTSGNNGTYFLGNYGNAILVGGQLDGYEPANPVFTPAEAKSIDDKIDDGMPGLGVIMTRIGTAAAFAPNCNTGTVSTDNKTATYLLSYNSPACALYYLRAIE